MSCGKCINFHQNGNDKELQEDLMNRLGWSKNEASVCFQNGMIVLTWYGGCALFQKNIVDNRKKVSSRNQAAKARKC